MIALRTIRNLYDYNYWARDQQLQSCAALSEEQFLRPMGNSFSSLRDTLAHLVGAEWIWLERWRGHSPTPEEAKHFAAETFPTLAAVEGRWRDVERGVRDYLGKLEEAALAGTLSYVNLKGERYSYALWQALFHLVNHQSYHRGQVTTLLRQLGAGAPQIDYLVAIDSGL